MTGWLHSEEGPDIPSGSRDGSHSQVEIETMRRQNRTKRAVGVGADPEVLPGRLPPTGSMLVCA